MATHEDWEKVLAEFPSRIGYSNLHSKHSGLYCTLGWLGHVQGFQDEYMEKVSVIGSVYQSIGKYWDIDVIDFMLTNDSDAKESFEDRARRMKAYLEKCRV